MDAVDIAAAAVALGPVREALLASAHRDADDLVAAARREADDVVHSAEQHADDVVEQARHEGEADALTALAADRARARRRARGVVLGAQRAAYEALRREVHEQLRSLGAGPTWPSARGRLEQLARRALDGDAPQPAVVPSAVTEPTAGTDSSQVTEDTEVTDIAGGVRARRGTRAVEVTLDSVADAHLDALGPELGRLWAP